MPAMICASCGTPNDGTTEVRGSIGMELVLWLCFLVPGLLYSIWRLTTKRRVCRACHQPSLVPIKSPVGQKLMREAGHAAPGTAYRIGRAVAATLKR